MIPRRWHVSKALWLILCPMLLQFAAHEAFSIEPAQTLSNGRAAVASGNYQLADEQFTKLVDHGYASVEILHERATARGKLGKLGPAVADIREALTLRPGDPELVSSLGELRTHIQSKHPPGPSPSFASVLTPIVFVLGQFGLDCFTLCLLGLSGAILFLKGRRISNTSFLGIAFVICITSMIFECGSIGADGQFGLLFERGRGLVVIPDELIARAAPNESSQAIFVLHSGDELWSKQVIDGWRQVELGEGRRGWVPLAQTFEVLESEPLFSRWFQAFES